LAFDCCYDWDQDNEMTLPGSDEERLARLKTLKKFAKLKKIVREYFEIYYRSITPKIADTDKHVYIKE
jgi:hypothetical protein